MNELNYKKLIVWQKSLLLMKSTYEIVELLPKHEDYNLKSQLKRASISVLSNIAEGSTRRSSLERRRFYEIARGSVVEIDAQIEASLVLDYFKQDTCSTIKDLVLQVFRMLSKMIDTLDGK